MITQAYKEDCIEMENKKADAVLETLPEKLNPQENRMCLVDGKKALFHKWVTVNFPAKLVYNDYYGEEFIVRPAALIEYEDGRCWFARPENVRFLDTKIFMEGGIKIG